MHCQYFLYVGYPQIRHWIIFDSYTRASTVVFVLFTNMYHSLGDLIYLYNIGWGASMYCFVATFHTNIFFYELWRDIHGSPKIVDIYKHVPFVTGLRFMGLHTKVESVVTVLVMELVIIALMLDRLVDGIP